MRQIVLDTETTGLETRDGHRIIEIGCVELVERQLTGNNFHEYINPERAVDAGALEVHGISNEFLADKPRFGEIAERFLEYVDGAELVIHNAAFDLGFLDYEYGMLGMTRPPFSERQPVIDTLELARSERPGQRNNLDALCKAYEVDNTSRTLHGALLDAEILADVYLAMTGGQVALGLSMDSDGPDTRELEAAAGQVERPPVRVLRASEEEIALHEARLADIKSSSGDCLWLDQLAQE
ncbi:DNA polymerase III subunit epsilon [Marinihelvus fidelis]|uniref:DNA polymerase III subunit epsilon n=1 Tax=Marinihelvus fidelis TaxID=2613842 RepID=A0A5N0TDL5_9GAMM|nr:DNA polymerase III subunit epsilon [Marinihelvus fidelis]KAA9133122.1 DNA polymerase III subunit epsilon [Marinihelvus fidelis]